jgi:hypothetical protein
MKWCCVILAAVLAVTGCTTPNPSFCDESTACSGGRQCNLTTNTCEGGAIDAGTPDAPQTPDAPITIDARMPDARPPDVPIEIDARPPDARVPDATIFCGDAGMTCPADQPVCTHGVCGPCTQSSDCTSAAAPICDTGSGRCVACGNSTQCTQKSSATPFCDTQAPLVGECVACLQATDCKDSKKPICDDTSGACVACSGNTQCMTAYPDTPFCSLSDGTGGAGSCVECRSFTDCSNVDTPICSSGSCVKCAHEQDCVGHVGTPHCDTNSGACVACVNSLECEDASKPTCDGDVCRKCETDPDCTAHTSTPFCDIHGTGTCVACNMSSECPVAAPVCDNSSCRVCRLDSECPSNACDAPSGTCLATNQVVYVDNTAASPSAACTQDHPCTTIAAGLALVSQTRQRLNLTGTYNENVSIDSIAVDIVGTNAVIGATANNTPVVSVVSQSTASLTGVTIQNAPGGTTSNNADGVACVASNVTLKQVTIRNNVSQGIDASACTLLVDRTMVSGNTGGGMLLTETTFNVTNSFFVNNGSAQSGTGGVRIVGTSSGHFDFNTVASNTSNTAAVGGLWCVSTAGQMSADSDIIWNNGGANNWNGTCNFNYSDTGAGGQATGGTGNFSADPLFIGNGDFHLMATSPCVGKGDPLSTLDHDYDGDPRTSPPECGADEIGPSSRGID